MTFSYQVRDPLGKIHDGTLEAGNLEEASQILLRDGFQVLKLEAGDDSDAGLFPRRIKKKDIICVTSQLAVMVGTGITLSVAIEGIAEQEENPSLRKLLRGLKSRVESGEDFSVALAEYPRYFDKTFVALIRASEQTGQMGDMLERIAGYLHKEMEMRGKVRAAMAYPTVMLFLAVGVTIFLLTFVLPKFEPLFNKKDIKLPTPTIVMMALSDILLGYWYLWLLGVVAILIAYFVGRRTEPGRKAIDWVKIHAPIIGPLFRKVTISRSLRTLGAMVKSGVSMLDAIQLSSEVSGNYFYERLWQEVLNSVTAGNRICETLAGSPLFPATLVQMIGAGEETGKLDVVLEKVSTHYDQEVEVSLKTATSLIEPIMISVMGVIVGGIGLALLLPIFSLSRGH